ncbi:retrovirus-related pol polyprotein from transposon TNT 1-94 [Tanacetum coccineum]
MGTSRTYTPGASRSNLGKQRTIICYNCKGEGHMTKQCTKPKRKQDDSWFKDKVLLVQAQASGQILHEKELAFLTESRNSEGQAHDVITHKADSCAQSVEIDLLKQTLSEHLKEKESLMQTVTLLKNDFKKEESRNIDREIALEKRIKQLDNIKAQQLEPKLYVGDIIEKTNTIVIPDSEETLMLAEESQPTLSSRPTKVEVLKELPKVRMVYTSLKKLKYHLAGFDVVVKEHPQPSLRAHGGSNIQKLVLGVK